jgi:hypothetical protein
MIKTVFLQYLLMPLFAIIAGSFMVVMKKKNQLLGNRKLIVFLLLYSLLMAIPGFFGFLENSFTPWYYMATQIIYLLMGIAFVHFYDHYIKKDITQYKALFQLSVMLVIVLLGGYLFAVVYNLFNQAKNGYIAVTSMLTFFLPLVFYWTYAAFIAIPFEIYKVWEYPKGMVDEISFDGQDFNKLMVLELEFSRQPDDVDRLRVKAKAPADIPFGEWFRKFIDDYNYKFPNSTIVYRKDDGNMHGWVFYSKPSFFHRRRLLDPEQTISQNNIREHITITSKRVIERQEEYFHKVVSSQNN